MRLKAIAATASRDNQDISTRMTARQAFLGCARCIEEDTSRVVSALMLKRYLPGGLGDNESFW